MPKISVIVPVYNVEKYLNRCVDSILSQTFEDFELILVDDGSKDNSGQICDEYADLDNRVKVIHKENAGVSSARNTGIDISQGEFISFVDADDWFENNALQLLYDASKNCDIIFGGYKSINLHGCNEFLLKKGVADNESLTNMFIDSFLASNHIFTTVWAKMYRADIIKNNAITFDSNIHSGEDTIFNIELCRHCKNAAFIDSSIYNYERRNATSATKKYFPNVYEYKIAIYQSIHRWLSSYGKNDDLRLFYSLLIVSSFGHYLSNCSNRIAKNHFLRIFANEKQNILENVELISSKLGGGYDLLIKNERWNLFIIYWKLRHIKIYIKRLIKAVLKM